MDVPNASSKLRDNAPKVDSLNSVAAVELLGGEPLEGSGFEHEIPDPTFQFDLTQLKDRSKGDLR